MTQPHIRVLVVDDHLMVAGALAEALALTGRIAVDGVVGSLAELRDFCQALPDPQQCPDVAVIDYRLPDGTGVDAVRVLRAHCPLTRSILLSATTSPSRVRAALDAGCVAYLNKSAQLEELFDAVHAAARGVASFDETSVQLALSSEGSEPEHDRVILSPRELQILAMLAEGDATEVMAAQLGLSQHTIRNHVRNLTLKLGAHSRLEAVSIAARAGLLTLVQVPRGVRPAGESAEA